MTYSMYYDIIVIGQKGVIVMGIYLNPTNSKYQELLNSKIVVDKSLLIEKQIMF